MHKRQTRILVARLLFLSLLCGLALAAGACNSARSSAEKTVDEYLKNQGVRDVKFDFFHTDSKFPDKSYISATVTHNFASSDGNFKKEYLGFILSREGEGWRIEKTTGHTTKEDEATTLLSGEKIRRHN
jgi:hypothetical protein